MRRRAIAFLAVAAVLATSGAALAEPAPRPTPRQIVERYFAALAREDFDGAIALTDGDARARTVKMAERIRQEAARKRARVDVQVRSLWLGAVTRVRGAHLVVDAGFDIRVIGRRYFFSRVARHIRGTAEFVVEPGSLRIVEVTGALLR